MSRPVMDSKLCRGTLALHRPIAVAARDAISTAISVTMAMRWAGTSKNMRVTAVAMMAVATVTTAAAAAQYRPVTLASKNRRAHVGTPVTNAHIVRRLRLEKKKTTKHRH